MPVSQQLLERAAQLKEELVAYAEHRRLRKELDRALREQFGPVPPADEADLVDALERFAFEYRLHDGRTVVERFVADRRDLSETDRAILLGWRDAVEGVFEVEWREGETLVAQNLLDERSYRIHPLHDPRAFRDLKRGMFLNTRIAPLGDEWVVSGAVLYLKQNEREQAEETAAGLAIADPELVFRNPAKLEEGWRRQRRSRDHFIRFFGSDLIVVPGAELEQRMRAYRHDALYTVRDEKGETVAERIHEHFGEYPREDPAIDEDLFDEETVGVLYEEDGIYYLPDYGRVMEAFADPSLAGEKRRRAAVKEYIEDSDLPPAAIQRLAVQDEARANEVIGTVMKRREFSWSRDGEDLLRRYKREYYEEQPRPTFTPLSDRLEKARARLIVRLTEGLKGTLGSIAEQSEEQPPLLIPKAGRNDPCPCGSGKKYKRCHGA